MQKLSRREALVGTAAVAAATVLPVPKAIPAVEIVPVQVLTFNVEIAAASMLDSLGALWGVVRYRHIGETDSSFRQRIIDQVQASYSSGMKLFAFGDPSGSINYQWNA